MSAPHKRITAAYAIRYDIAGYHGHPSRLWVYEDGTAALSESIIVESDAMETEDRAGQSVVSRHDTEAIARAATPLATEYVPMRRDEYRPGKWRWIADR